MSNEIEPLLLSLQSNPADANAFDSAEAFYVTRRFWGGLIELFENGEAHHVRRLTHYWRRLAEQLELIAGELEDPVVRAKLLMRTALIWEEKEGRADLAIKNLQAAFKLNPADSSALDRARAIYGREQKWDMVRRLWTVQLQVETDDLRRSGILVEVARIDADRLGQRESARAQAENALRLDPTNAEAAAILANLTAMEREAAAQAAAPTPAPAPAAAPTPVPEPVAAPTPVPQPVAAPTPVPEPVVAAAAAPASPTSSGSRPGVREAIASGAQTQVANADAYALIGEARAAHARGEDDAMLARLKKAFETDPLAPGVVDGARELLAEAGRATDYARTLEAGLRSRGPARDDVEYLARLGAAWAAAGDDEAADKQFRRVRVTDPKNTQMLDFYADFARKSGDFKRLATTLQSMLDVAPDDAARLPLLAEIAEISETQLANVTKAVDAWTQLLRIDRDHVEGRTAMRRLLGGSQKWNKLLEFLKEEVARDLEPAERSELLREVLAIYRDRLNLPAQVTATLVQLTETDPADADAFAALRDRYASASRWREAHDLCRAHADAALDATAQRNALMEAARIASERLSRPELAREAMERAVALDPNDAEARRGLRSVLEGSSDSHALLELLRIEIDAATGAERDNAIRAAARAADSIDPHSVDALELQEMLLDLGGADATAASLRLGAAYEADGRFSDAARVLGVAWHAAPSAELGVRLAELHERSGDEAAAIEVLTRLLASSPNHPTAAANLRRLLVDSERWDEAEALAAADSDAAWFVDGLKAAASRDSEPTLWRRLASFASDRDTYVNEEFVALEELVAGTPTATDVARLASIASRLGDHARAASAAEQAAELDPAHTASWLAKAVQSWIDADEGDRALAAATTLFEREPSADNRDLLDQAAVCDGQPHAAVAAVQRVAAGLASGAERLDHLRFVAHRQSAAGASSTDELAAWEDVLLEAPDDDEALAELAELCAATQSWARAADIHRTRISRATPADAVQMRLDLAELLFERLGDSDGAADVLDDLVAAASTDRIDVMLRAAAFWSSVGETSRAAGLWAAVLDENSAHSEAFARLYAHYESTGDYAGCAALLDRRADSVADQPHETRGLRLEAARVLRVHLRDLGSALDSLDQAGGFDADIEAELRALVAEAQAAGDEVIAERALDVLFAGLRTTGRSRDALDLLRQFRPAQAASEQESLLGEIIAEEPESSTSLRLERARIRLNVLDDVSGATDDLIALLGTGEDADAASLLDGVVTAGSPDSVRAADALVERAALQDREIDGVAVLRELAAAWSEVAPTALHRARSIAESCGDAELTFEVLRELISLDGASLADAQAILALGRGLDRLGEAATLVESAVERGAFPGEEDAARADVCDAYADLGAFDEAVTHARALLESSRSEENFDRLESLLRQSEAWAELVTALRERLDFAPSADERKAVGLRLADTLAGPAGDQHGAGEVLAALADENAGDTELNARLEASLVAAGDFASLASRMESRADSLAGRDRALALVNASELLRNQLGDADAALSLLDRAVDADPSCVEVVTALEATMAAAAGSPAAGEAGRILARAYRAAGNYEELAATLEAAASSLTGPDAAALWVEAADVRERQLNDAPGGFTDVRNAVIADPADATLRLRLLRNAAANDAVEVAADLLLDLADSADPEVRADIARDVSANIDAAAHPELARRALEALVDADPADATNRLKLDALLDAEGDHAARVEHLRRAAAMVEGDARVELLLAAATICDEELGRLDETAALLELAAEDATDSASVFARLAVVHERAERWADAVAAHRAHADAAHDTTARALALSKAASLLIHALDDHAGAADVIIEAIENDPRSEEARALLEELFADERAASRRAPMAAALEPLLDESRDAGLLLPVLGALIDEGGDDETTNARVARRARVVLTGNRRDLAALASLLAALERDPTQAGVLTAAESFAAELGAGSELATACLQAVGEHDPYNAAELLHAAGRAFAADARNDDAATAWRVALERDPRDAVARDGLEQALEANGDAGSLALALEERIDTTADPTERRAARVHLAILHEDGNRLDESLETWTAIVDENPADVEALDAIERLAYLREDWERLAVALRMRADSSTSTDDRRDALTSLANVTRDRLQRPVDALEVAREAVLVAGDDPTTLELLAEVTVAAAQSLSADSPDQALSLLTEVADGAFSALALGGLGALSNDPDIGGDADAVIQRTATRLGAWELAANAAERRATHLEGAERGALLREAAVTRAEKLDDYPYAVALAGAACAADADEREAWGLLERLCGAQGDQSAFIAAADSLAGEVSDGTFRAELCERAAHRAEAADDAETAERLYRLALGDAAEPTAILEALEALLTERGDVAGTIGILRERLERTWTPGDRVETLLRLAHLAETGLSDVGVAIDALREALDVAPSDLRVLEELERLTAAEGDWRANVEILELRANVEGATEEGVLARRRLANIARASLGDDAAAIDALEGALSLVPGHDGALGDLISIRRDRGDFSEVAELLEVAARHTRDATRRVELLLEAADVRHRELDDAPGALDVARSAYRELPSDARAWTTYSGLLRETEEWSELVDALRSQLAGAGDAAAIALRIEIAEIVGLRLSDAAGAEIELRAVLESQPANHGAAISLARLLRESGRPAEAREVLENSLGEDAESPGSAPLWRELGVLTEAEDGSAELRISLFERALELDPSDTGAIEGLSRAASELGEHDRLAELHGRRAALSQGRERAEWLARRAEALEQAGVAPADRLAAWRDAVAADPSSVRVVDRALGMARASGDGATARAIAAAHVGSTPAPAEARRHFVEGMAAIASGDRAGAEVAWRAAYKANSQFFAVLLELGALLGEAQNDEEALQFLQRALLSAGSEPADRKIRLFVLVGQLRARGGDAAKAREMFRRALAIEPQNAAAKEGLAGIGG